MADPNGRGRCQAHRKVGWYDRPSAHTLEVDEGRMRRIRARLLYGSPLCEHCYEAEATEVDHIVPVAGAERTGQSYPPGWGMGSLYDPANLQVLCHECHARKSQAEQAELREWRQRHKPRSRRQPRKRSRQTRYH